MTYRSRHSTQKLHCTLHLL